MISIAQRIVDSKAFHATVISVILLVGVLAGLETNAALVASHGTLLRSLDHLFLALFVAEIALKLAAHGRRPLDYFKDGWNVFDFSVVVLCLLPWNSQFAAVLRLIRTLRLLRLVSALPKLQLLVGALIKSFGSMGYVGLLLSLMFYIYAITGVHLFGGHDKEHFGSLSLAFFTLFQTITLDDWKFLFDSAKGSSPAVAAIYFISFILLGTMIMLNLFIGIIMNSMEEMHTELDKCNAAKRDDSENTSVIDDLAALDEQMKDLQIKLSSLRDKLKKEAD